MIAILNVTVFEQNIHFIENWYFSCWKSGYFKACGISKMVIFEALSN